MKTFDRYSKNDELFFELSCDDGSIVKVEIHSKILGDWFDITDLAKTKEKVREMASKFFDEYLDDKKTESHCDMNYKGFFDDIFGNGPKGAA